VLQRSQKERSYQEVLHIAVADVGGKEEFVAVAVDLSCTREQIAVGSVDTGLKRAAAVGQKTVGIEFEGHFATAQSS
jgi:hypothetical protein